MVGCRTIYDAAVAAANAQKAADLNAAGTDPALIAAALKRCADAIAAADKAFVECIGASTPPQDGATA